MKIKKIIPNSPWASWRFYFDYSCVLCYNLFVDYKYILFWGLMIITSLNVIVLGINVGLTFFIFYITKNVYNKYSEEGEVYEGTRIEGFKTEDES